MDVVTTCVVRAVVTQRNRRLGEAVGVSGDLMGVVGPLKEQGEFWNGNAKKKEDISGGKKHISKPPELRVRE